MQCVILCGGFATRLRPLTLDRPKHLLPIAGRPMLDHLMDRLAESDVRRGIVMTNRKFIASFRAWHAATRHAFEVDVLDDGTETNETRLGSIGDLRFGLETADLRDDFVVVNGDNLFTFSLGPFFETFRRRGSTIAMYDVGSFEVAKLMGHAVPDSNGRIIDFVEKPPQPTSTLASIGIYAFRAEVRGLVNRYLDDGHAADRTGDFVAWLHKHTPVFGHVFTADAGVWFDIGSFDQYDEANRAFGGAALDASELSLE